MAPSPTALDLHWRLFGIDFRVQPMFWIINLVFGYMYVSGFNHAEQHLWAYMGIWLACAFVSILIHELGHVSVARVFGVPSDIVLHGMGGVAIGHFDRLQRWQRILISAAGPIAGLLLFAFAEWGLPLLVRAYDPLLLSSRWYSVVAKPYELFQEGERIGRAAGCLIIMNLVWNLFNLLPIIPLDGGMIMREVCSGIFPRQGARLAFALSFLIAGSLAMYSVFKMLRPDIPYPEDISPLFTALMFGWIAFNSFAAMRAEEATAPRRWRDYEERDW